MTHGLAEHRLRVGDLPGKRCWIVAGRQLLAQGQALAQHLLRVDPGFRREQRQTELGQRNGQLGIGMLATELGFPSRQYLLEQGRRFFELICGPIRRSQAVQGGEGGEVVGPELLHPGIAHLFEQFDGLRQLPGVPVCKLQVLEECQSVRVVRTTLDNKSVADLFEQGDGLGRLSGLQVCDS